MHAPFVAPGRRGMLAADPDMNVVHMDERRLGFMAIKGNISRRGLLAGAVAVAATAAGTTGGTAAAASRGPAAGSPRAATPLWREFAAAPFTHPQIPFIGRAGYRTGSRPPRRTGRGFVADVRRYGAKPDGSADAAPAINRAIADAGEHGGGTVLVPEGTYRIDDLVRIGHSDVVVRGAGSGRTRLHATRNLTELIGAYGSRYGGDKSSWSWAGGLIWLCPKDRWASLTDAIRAKSWPFEGWTGNRRDEWRTLTTVAPARRGDRSITVRDATGLRRGGLVLLRLADDAGHTLLEHMAGGGPGPEAYFWDDKTKLTSYVPYEWPVRVTSVHGHRVTLERPLPLDVRPEWDPRLTTLVTPLTGSGVEGLTLEAVETPQSPHLLDGGTTGSRSSARTTAGPTTSPSATSTTASAWSPPPPAPCAVRRSRAGAPTTRTTAARARTTTWSRTSPSSGAPYPRPPGRSCTASTSRVCPAAMSGRAG
ncbi:hypothetical protein GCM10010433_06100 [Streptomyces pulveraceus]